MNSYTKECSNNLSPANYSILVKDLPKKCALFAKDKLRKFFEEKVEEMARTNKINFVDPQVHDINLVIDRSKLYEL